MSPRLRLSGSGYRKKAKAVKYASVNYTCNGKNIQNYYFFSQASQNTQSKAIIGISNITTK